MKCEAHCRAHFIFLMAGTLIINHRPMQPIKAEYYNYTTNTVSTIHNIQGKYKVLIARSSYINSNRKEAKSVFHHFCPGLPLLFTLCIIK